VTSNGTNGIQGALVSVQRYNGSAGDPKDQIIIQTSTITDEDGYFSIFVSPLTDSEKYNLVVYAEGKLPVYREIITLESGETLSFFGSFDRGFIQLSDTPINNVNGLVMITGASNEQYVSVSFGTNIGDETNIEMIEVTSLNVANMESYNIDLPNGAYSVVASALNYDNIEMPLTVTETVSPIDFPITLP